MLCLVSLTLGIRCRVSSNLWWCYQHISVWHCMMERGVLVVDVGGMEVVDGVGEPGGIRARVGTRARDDV